MHGWSSQIVTIGLAAQSARRQPKTISILAKHWGEAGGIARKIPCVYAWPSFRADTKYRRGDAKYPESRHS
jgi:hypothetical protein